MSTSTPLAATTGPAPAADSTITRPRTRWAAIIWGALFAAVAAGALWLLSADDRRAGVADWTTSLSPTTISALLILTIGVLLLVAGASALVRRAQRGIAARSGQHPLGHVPAE
jgi:hypothetical protein